MTTFFTYNNLTMIMVNFPPSIALVADFENWSEFEDQQIKILKNLATEKGLKTTLLVPVASDYNPGLWNQENIKLLAKQAEVDFVIFYVIHKMMGQTPASTIYENLANFLNLQEILIAKNFQTRCYEKFNTTFFSQHWGERCHVELDYAQHQTNPALLTVLQTNDFKKFHQLSGLHFCFSSRVVHGKQKGRTIGYPTINLLTPESLLISRGVYACEVSITGIEEKIIGAGFYWENELNQDLFEIFLLDFDQDVYGRKVDVEIKAKIREPETFDSLELLKAALTRDVEQTRKVFLQNEK